MNWRRAANSGTRTGNWKITAGATAGLVVAGIALVTVMPYFVASWYAWRGDQLERHGRIAAAAAAYQQAFQEKPSARTLEKLGRLYVKARMPTRAVQVLQTAVTMAPRDSRAHYDLGMGLLTSGDRESARQELRRATELDVSNGDAHLALSRMAFDEGDTATGDQELSEAVRYGVNSPEAHLRMAEIYLAHGDQRAEDELKAALRQDPILAPAQFRLALIEMDRDPSDAMAQLESAIVSGRLPGGDQARALGALALLQLRTNQMAQTVATLRQALDMHPDRITLAALEYAAGVARRQSGDATGAWEAFHAAAAHDPVAPAIRAADQIGQLGIYGQALLDLKDGRLPAAEQECRSLLQMAPADVEYRKELAAVLTAKGDLPAAVAELRQVEAAAPEDPEIRLSLASVLVQEGKLNAGQQALERAIALAPIWPHLRPDVALLKGKIQLALNQPQQALPYLELAAANHSPSFNNAEAASLLHDAVDRTVAEQAAHAAIAQSAVTPAPMVVTVRPAIAIPRGLPGRGVIPVAAIRPRPAAVRIIQVRMQAPRSLERPGTHPAVHPDVHSDAHHNVQPEPRTVERPAPPPAVGTSTAGSSAATSSAGTPLPAAAPDRPAAGTPAPGEAASRPAAPATASAPPAAKVPASPEPPAAATPAH